MEYPVKGTPKEHQSRALAEAGLKGGHCFWMDPGAGKTFTCIAEAGKLFLDGKIDGVLIVAPNGPHRQWVEEQFPLWADYPHHSVHNKQTAGQRKTYFHMRRPGLGVAAVNYHALNYPSGQDFVGSFMALYPRIYLVIDESQKVKDPKTLWSKRVKEIALQATYRRALSGTPQLNGLEDLWHQYHCIEPNVTGFSYFTAFKRHYCIQRPIPGARSRFAMQIVGYQNEDELLRRTAAVATRVPAEEFMKDAKPTFSKVWVPMEKSEWVRAYKDMRETMLLELENDEIAVENALGVLQKLQQLCCGFVYDEEGQAHWYDHSRVRSAVELLEELSEPVIVWTPYRALSEALRAALDEAREDPLSPFSAGTYSKDDVEEWRQDPKGVLIGNQSSGLGVGMNLQHAAAAIYLGNTYSAEHRWQSIKRIDRIGQERQVRIWDMVTPGTVDDKILEALETKKQLAVRTVDGLRNLMK